jgi:hypothetical protein
VKGVDCWLTIEVSDGASAASSWRDAHEDSLIEAAVTHGARDWGWQTTAWGLVLEIEFTTEEARNRFRGLPAVRAALDAVPDPVNGLYVYPGRGGGAGALRPTRPRPTPAAGAIELEEPADWLELDLRPDEIDPRSGDRRRRADVPNPS